MENIRFENLVMDVGRAFEVRLNQTLKETVASSKTIRNISFCHVTGKVYMSSRIRGNGVGRIDNVLLSDVDLDYYGVGPAPFVDATGMWARDSSDAAFEVEHASHVRLQDIRCRFLGPGRDGWKHAVRCQDASGFLCRDCDFEHLDTIS